MAKTCGTCGLPDGEHYAICPNSPDYYGADREREDSAFNDYWPSDFPMHDECDDSFAIEAEMKESQEEWEREQSLTARELYDRETRG